MESKPSPMTHQTSRSSHVLITLGILFTVCGAARFLPEGQAAADEATSPGDAKEVTTDSESAAKTDKTYPISKADYESSAPTDLKTDQVCFNGDMAAALSQDRWMFEEREDKLNEQQLTLQEWDNRLRERANELEALENVLDQRWQQMQAVSDSDIKHLALMYGSMKPDQASPIFNKMDANFAAGFLRQLPSDQAGLILANMETDKAYVVSVRLASLNDDIRKATE